MLELMAKPAFKAGVLGVIIFGLAWGWHLFLKHEQQIGYDRAVGEYAEKLAAAKDAAAATEREWNKQLEEARNAATLREQEKDKRIADLGAVTRGLRGTLADLRNGLSGGSLDACRATAAALSSVFGECQDALGEMGRSAEGHLDDTLMLLGAWPRR